ncbi:hypothetical protein ACM66Z_07535 [Sulfurovum sp. ST-21]|uniref:Uncharacterized protein n=1 Tax=Sulfurovum indicum TaxID=2779528 RepID=A0A7M1S1P2_9BACT|nr:hypothetical protein [Sulfurovum indicum]QOR61298.1 hypothetical protein IMZ28_07530 [Sulfurovum indicum]
MTNKDIEKIYENELKMYQKKSNMKNVIGFILVLGTVVFPPIGIILIIYIIYAVFVDKSDMRYDSIGKAQRINELKKEFNID